MSSKEIKAALKSAKTSIQAKDFETALQHCEFILNKDSTNYNALVFAGLCYSETSQNEKAREKYKNAINSQLDQILAYQGFANLYTKHWKKEKTKDELDELISIYEKLLVLTDGKDVKKRSELTLSLCNAEIEAGYLVKALQIISDEQDIVDSNVSVLFDENVFKILEKLSKDNWNEINKFSTLINRSFKHLLQTSTNSKQSISYLQIYVTFVQNNLDIPKEKISDLLNVCTELNSKYPEERLPLEIMVQAHIQNYEHEDLTNIQDLITKLKNNGSSFADIGKGFLDYETKQFESSVNVLTAAMKENPSFLPGWVILCEAASKLHKYEETRQHARNGLLNFKEISKPTWLLPITSMNEIQYKLSKYLATGLCGSCDQNDISKGIGTFEKLIKLHPEDISLHTRISEGYIKLEKYSEASDYLKQVIDIEPDNIDAKAWIEFVNFKTSDQESAITNLQSLSPTASTLYLLGKCMWDAGGGFRTEKKHCFTALVKAAKLDPYRSETFLLLGHFYSKVQRDNTRAKGCYQKAYLLDKLCEDSAACLADAYVADDETASAIELYESITKGAGSTTRKWAWLRLGLYKLKAKDMSDAIKCFLSALRIDAEDSICWECLGEGYLQRGSYSAAWKAFDKSHQLNPESIYSLYQMAKLKQVQGLYPEAIVEYGDVLELKSDYVPALQGLGESELLLGRQMFYDGRYQTGIEHLEKAIKILTQACCLRKDLCCLWKLLGDCCAMVHSLDSSIVHMTVPIILIDQKQNNDVKKTTKIGKNEVLSLNSRFYCRAIQIQQDNGSLWHDLGLSYFRRAEELDRFGDEDSLVMAENAMNAVKKAITFEQSNHLFWNSLGVIAACSFIKEPALAQHCFLMSIKHEQNNVQAWSNLATLYLFHDHIKLAHEAFKVAQSLEPSFVNSWIGQALIAGTIGSNDTMDLYRHSTELGMQKQGTVGYCSWVARVIADSSNRESSIFKENIRNTNAVAMATTQMSKLCDKNPKCPWSSTIHGFLLEHSGLNRSAETAYRQAYNELKDEVCEDEKDEKNFQTKKCNSVLNLARSLCKNGNYEEAISLYQQVVSSSDINFYDFCGLAHALYKSGQFEEALDAYKQAGQLTTSEEEKAQVMVAMAMTFWKMGKHVEAKTLLYQCFQTSKAGLRALLSLGIATKDKTLVVAAVGELIKMKSSNSEDVADDCLLISSAAKLCEDSKLALNEVQKALHLNPSSWSLRVLLCRLLVDLSDCQGIRSAPMISTHAERLFNKQCIANPLIRDSEQWKGPKRHCDGISILKSTALATVAGGSSKARSDISEQAKEKLRKAQIFAHMHPYDDSAWNLLSSACHASDVVDWMQDDQLKKMHLIESLAQYADKSRKVEINDWYQSIMSWNRILHGLDLETSEMVNDDTKFIRLVNMASKTQDKSKLQSIFKEITNILGNTKCPGRSSKYFGELLEHLNMNQVSKKMFEKSIALNPTNKIEQVSTYFRIIRLAYYAATKDESKAKDWIEMMKTTMADIVKIDTKSPHSLFLQGLVLRVEKNHRKSRSLFNRVLNSSEIISDQTKNLATWYQYRNLQERNDIAEIQKLVGKALERSDENIVKLIEILPAQ